MYVGLDFGTSNCALGIWQNGGPQLVPLEDGSHYLPAAMYSPLGEIAPIEIDESVLNQRVRDELPPKVAGLLERSSYVAEKEKLRKAKTVRDSKLTPGAIEKADRAVEKQLKKVEEFRKLDDQRQLEEVRQRTKMEKELLDELTQKRQQQTLDDTLRLDEVILFGNAALEQYYRKTDEGLLAKSPKLFLGEPELRAVGIKRFSRIVGLMLTHMKKTAEEHTGQFFHNVVLGRPVNFSSSGDEDANRQGEQILRNGATTAGFEKISFLLEPIAAALDFEAKLTHDVVALIVDSGGGTTDCTVATLGPSYRGSAQMEERILANSGTRAGGVDLDTSIARRIVMPHFGEGTRLKNGEAIPNRFFSQAIAINEMKTMEKFYARNLNGFLANPACPEKVNRLKHLHKHRQGQQVVGHCEEAKIVLSEVAECTIPLEFIEEGFGVPLNREGLHAVVEATLEKISGLISDVVEAAKTKPDLIYVTGGTAKSPLLMARIQSHFPDLKIVSGDNFGSVASGLVLHAHRMYG